MPDSITYSSGGEELLAEIKSLWRGLNEHHEMISPHFSDDFRDFTFEQRIDNLMKKCIPGKIRVTIAKNQDQAVGYVISSVTDEDVGEIESIFIQESFRQQQVGDGLMLRALAWFDSVNVRLKIVSVAVGNEAVYPFYARFGFFPRVTLLKQQVVRGNSDPA